MVANTRDTVLPGLKERTVEVLACEVFLMDFVRFADDESRRHVDAFRSVGRVTAVLLDSAKTVKEKTQRFKAALLDRAAEFKNQLDVYKSETDKLVDFGDVGDVGKYSEIARRLDDGLTGALDTIDELNREEKYFELRETAYPLRKFVNII